MPVVTNPFRSLYGFQSPSFSVDAAGNVQILDLAVTGDSVLSNAIIANLTVNTSTTLNSTVLVANNSTAAALNSAALIVVGGVSIQDNLLVNGDINSNTNLIAANDVTALNSLVSNSITTLNDGSTLSDLIIEPLGDVVFKTASQSVEVGRINAVGSNLPVVDTTINNTTIGLTVASTAAFVSGTVSTTPAGAAAITRKDYVDRTAVAFAVALGS